MSISPAQMQAALAEIALTRTVPTLQSSLRGDADAAPKKPPSDPLLPKPSFSTDLQIDNDHQLYYEFLAGGTGNVDFEIPPEALRNIAESLTLPMTLGGGISTIDVKT